jgi:hypothetical protein
MVTFGFNFFKRSFSFLAFSFLALSFAAARSSLSFCSFAASFSF